MNFNEFIAILNEKGLILTKMQQEQFLKFYELLISWNEKMNLTAITTFEEVLEKHFYDSLTPFNCDFNHKSLVDIGAGAGFPSIPLKIAYPDLEITIVDSLGKRMTFINEVIKELSLKKIKTIITRGEDFARLNPDKFDYVSARAVARLNILNEICIPLLKNGGTFIAYKGSDGLNEINECKNAITLLGGKIENIDEFTLPNEKSLRINIYIKKIKNTPSIYPREFAKIKKRPLE